MNTQMRYARLFIAVTCLLLVFMPGCKANSLTAADILSQSDEKMNDVKTMKMALDLTTQAGGFNLQISAEGVIEQPDKAYLKMSVLGQTIEVLAASQTEVYMRDSNSAKWEPVSADELSMTGVNVDMLSQMQLSEIAMDPKLAGTEKVNGTECHHLTFDVDVAKYLQTEGQATSGDIDLASTKATGEAWIGRDDLLMRKFSIVLSTTSQGTSGNVSTTITLSDYNEPVDIPTP